jgi:hypothetical protein
VTPADWRTVGELLADCDAMARDTLLDATLDHALAMVRSWNQLVRSAAELWTELPSAPDNPSGPDPIARLSVVGAAIGRTVRAGHWPGQGPTDEHLTQIADNLSRARHLVERHGRPSQPNTPDTQSQLQQFHGQVMHTLYVAAPGTAVAFRTYVTDLQHRLEVGTRRRKSMAERPTTLEITAAIRLETALAAWENQAHRTLANGPDAADLVRVARVQALIVATTGILTQAAARRGHIDGELLRRLAPALEASQVAWHRMAKRCGELTSPASRTDRSLVGAASEVRDAIAAIATNQTGWATADQLAIRVDLPKAVRTLRLGMIACADLAYIVRGTAADHPGLIAPARIIGMRAQGEAEIAIEQGETRYEGVTWTTPHQVAANQLIPLPEPARRGLITSRTTLSPRPNGLWPRPFSLTPALSRDQSDPFIKRLGAVPRSPSRSPGRTVPRQGGLRR